MNILLLKLHFQCQHCKSIRISYFYDFIFHKKNIDIFYLMFLKCSHIRYMINVYPFWTFCPICILLNMIVATVSHLWLVLIFLSNFSCQLNFAIQNSKLFNHKNNHDVYYFRRKVIITFYVKVFKFISDLKEGMNMKQNWLVYFCDCDQWQVSSE